LKTVFVSVLNWLVNIEALLVVITARAAALARAELMLAMLAGCPLTSVMPLRLTIWALPALVSWVPILAAVPASN